MNDIETLEGHFVKPNWITREQIRATRDTHIYLYGDTRELDAKGGQARAARGEPNAFAIPVKYRSCYLDESSFFSDSLYEEQLTLMSDASNKVPIDNRIIVVLPKLGEGFSEMKKRAPRTYFYLKFMLSLYDNI